MPAIIHSSPGEDTANNTPYYSFHYGVAGGVVGVADFGQGYEGERGVENFKAYEDERETKALNLRLKIPNTRPKLHIQQPQQLCHHLNW